LLSKRPVWIRFAVPIGVFAFVLLVEEGLINLFPTVTMLYYTLFLTAGGGAFIMSTFLPHPRQERKRRDALLAQEVAKHEETLAEKRP
jgi:hypothetical protein